MMTAIQYCINDTYNHSDGDDVIISRCEEAEAELATLTADNKRMLELLEQICNEGYAAGMEDNLCNKVRSECYWTKEYECRTDHDATEVVTASVETPCAVTDLEGNHCPEHPTHEVEFRGDILHLCDRCYENVQKGAYIAHLVKRAIDKIDEQIEYTMIYGVEGDTISPDDNTPISGE